ncbi:MAG: substrate-binding domain-containing protein [Acidobacteria bacterium]|nr:substrate-binding domain-containing protein [Acidobacteriota bacterium]
MTRSTPKRLYLIPVLSKALDILELLQHERGPMTLEAIYQRTNISKTTVYRILKTLVHRGYLAQSQDGLYRLVARPKKARFGFGAESMEMPFSEAVSDSLKAAATAAGVDLIVLDNRYDGPTALRNVEEFVQQHVDLIIEFQIDQRMAPVIADKIDGAGIPLIAVDIPHPHATFFGVDNYRVGFEAGEFLAEHARTTWDGKVTRVLGLDIPEAGPLVQSRVTGAFEGVRSKLPGIPEESLVRLDGRGLRDKSHRLVREFLERHPADRHHRDRGILIAAATDTSALGAVQAVKELKREKHVAIVGQDCIPEAIAEMSSPNSPLIASVSHEAPSYGPRLIHLGLALLSGQRVSPYNYVEHKLVTAEEVRRAR